MVEKAGGAASHLNCETRPSIDAEYGRTVSPQRYASKPLVVELSWQDELEETLIVHDPVSIAEGLRGRCNVIE